MGLASLSLSLFSKFTVCPLGASENASRLWLLPTRKSERLSAAPATVAVADSDRRLTFGSYAASSERQRERERASLWRACTMEGWKRKTASVVARDGGMEEGAAVFMAHSNRTGLPGRETKRICVAIRARPRAKSARVSFSGCYDYEHM